MHFVSARNGRTVSLDENVITENNERHTITWSGDPFFDQLNDMPVWIQNGSLDDGTYLMIVWDHVRESEDASDCANWERPDLLILDAERFYAEDESTAS